ncbi:MAG TPA: DUF924 family protein [Thiobacillaceae bacterium]|nr:DUF924 family protein [Thiobacillaceae bacterium]HNU63764.1 DUF924 family protein [Thiobacillaceae bacterium]
MPQEVLTFWFEETEPRLWWSASPDFDSLIRSRFLPLMQRAAQGELYAWRHEPKGRLAEVIVLDQFSRNVYRHTPAAFAQDPMALVLAQEAVAAGVLLELAPMERAFLLMPFMHSESRAIHVWAERLFREHAPSSSHEFELRHKAIIDRFGRYPHRNRILGRASSPGELAFLAQPGSGF